MQSSVLGKRDRKEEEEEKIHGLDDDEGGAETDKIAICTGDARFALSRQAACLSGVWKVALDEDPDATEIPVFVLTKEELEQVVDWVCRRAENPSKDLGVGPMRGYFESRYADLELSGALALASVANYLDINDLYLLSIDKIRSICYDMTAGDMKNFIRKQLPGTVPQRRRNPRRKCRRVY